MKHLAAAFSLIVLLLLSSCQDAKNQQASIEEESTITATNKSLVSNIFSDDYSDSDLDRLGVFIHLSDSSFYKNLTDFERNLGSYLKVQDLKVLHFSRSYAAGIEDSLYLINYDGIQSNDSTCAFNSSKRSIVFTRKGKALFQTATVGATFAPIMKDSTSVLITTEQECNGLGRHHVYKYINGKLVDILNPQTPESPITYDNDPKDGKFKEGSMFWQSELINSDSLLDIRLTGEWLILQDDKGKTYSERWPYKKEKKEFVFLYNPAKDLFLLQE